MTTTELNRPEIEAPPEPGSIGAGAEIYRRMERRSQRRPKWMMPASVVALAVIAAGGVVAYETMTKSNTATPPAQVQASVPAPAPAQVAPVTPPPAQVAAATPTPAPEARVVRIERARPVVAAKVARTRTARDANAAASASEDANAFTPPPKQAAPAAPIVATPAPAATAVGQNPNRYAPPQAASPAPAVESPQPAPAPQQ
jgi:hypothetical protein